MIRTEKLFGPSAAEAPGQFECNVSSRCLAQRELGRSRCTIQVSNTWASTAGPARPCSSSASSPFQPRQRSWWAGRSNKPHRRTSRRVPEHIGRDCVGPGRRRHRGRSLGAADRWSLLPAGGAVCSRSGSETSAAPQHSSAPGPAAPPSSDCQTTYWTGTPFGLNNLCCDFRWMFVNLPTLPLAFFFLQISKKKEEMRIIAIKKRVYTFLGQIWHPYGSKPIKLTAFLTFYSFFFVNFLFLSK